MSQDSEEPESIEEVKVEINNSGSKTLEDEEEPERRGLNFFGTDVSKIPCFKHSFMYAIGSGMLSGVAYNLAFSKSPYKLAFGVYTSVLFGYWFVCRYDYRSVCQTFQPGELSQNISG